MPCQGGVNRALTYKKNVERDVVMVLESKLRDSIAHKGMIFSTSGFQRGALEFAQKRGIATITVNEGHTNYHTRSADQQNIKPPAWINFPNFIGWFITINEEGNEAHSLIDDERIENLEKWLKA
jgi:restriction system protein